MGVSYDPQHRPPTLYDSPSAATISDRPSAPVDREFLHDSGVSTAALIEALEAATAWQVSVPAALIALGHLDAGTFARAAARALGVELVDRCEVTAAAPLFNVDLYPVRRQRLEPSASTTRYVVPAVPGPLSAIQGACARVTALGGAPVLATPAMLMAAVERADRAAALRSATLDLRRRHPTLSAGRRMPLAQAVVLATVLGLFLGGFFIAPGYSVAALLTLLTVSFVGVVLVRMVAVHAILRSQPRSIALLTFDAPLPRYTILVPLYDEAAVIGDLITSLSRLDYPAAKLEIILVLEEVDLATKIALLAPHLPPTFRTIVVPDAQPRTKPKALNYAMRFASGDYVVVFDAEDRPEPDQLRKAVAAFRDGPPNLACVQARLNLYNAKDSWFAQQFTIEYSALFDAILPALDRLGFPVPLGGTSNHFPRVLLQSIGGWDPFNVTEDADLGIRLARLGYTTQVLQSTTWEEAPVTWRQWLPQRTRWLKGWYQTYLVHTRHPIKLLRDLGPWRTLGFHLFLGGVILSTLVHPWFYAVLIWSWAAADTAWALPPLVEGGVLPWLAIATLGLGYGSAILVGAVAVQRRGHGLARSAFAMPLCWLLISVAAYRAVWQLWRDPFKWEKTRHGVAKSTAPPAKVPQSRRSGGP